MFGLASLLAAALTGWRGYIIGIGIVSFKDQIMEVVDAWTRSQGFGEFCTQFINTRLNEAGIDVQLRNVLDKQMLVDDFDKLAARRVNAKMGTDFTSMKTINRDQAFTEISRVMARQVNEATGSRLAVLYPPARLREELGTELLRQFTDADLSPGSLFPRARVKEVEDVLLKKMQAYIPPKPPPADPVKAAKNRERQKKYRRSHKQVWAER